MAECRLGPGSAAFRTPPDIFKQLGPEAHDYLLALHRQVFGLPPGPGTLDSSNIDTSAITGIDHANLVDVQPYQHHGAGAHEDIDQAAAVGDAGVVVATAVASTVAVTAGDPGGSYTAAEQGLLLELKQDLGQLVADFNAAVGAINAAISAAASDATTLNTLLAALRAAKVIST